MLYATFNNVSVIYRTCALGRGVQEALVFCHFQYCFSHLPLLCCRQRGSADSCFMPLLIMFQSFTTPLLQVGGSRGSCFMPLSIMFQSFTDPLLQAVCSGVSCFMTLSILFQSFTTLLLQAGGFRRLMFIATFNNVSVFYHTFAVGMGVQDPHALCNFQYSVIYHTIAIGRGVQKAHVYCHFQ